MRRFLGTMIADEFPDLCPLLVDRELINGVELTHKVDVRLLNDVLKVRPRWLADNPHEAAKLTDRALVLPERRPRIELVKPNNRKVS